MTTLLQKIDQELKEFNIFMSRLFGLILIYIWFYLVKEVVFHFGRLHGLLSFYSHEERYDWIWEVLFAPLVSPFSIFGFFNTLLFLVIPLTVLGVWLGHSRIKRASWREVIPAFVPSVLSILPPILFIASCTWSSYRIIFIWGTLNNKVVEKLSNLYRSVGGGWGDYFDQESFIFQFNNLVLWINESWIPLFDESHFGVLLDRIYSFTEVSADMKEKLLSYYDVYGEARDSALLPSLSQPYSLYDNATAGYEADVTFKLEQAVRSFSAVSSENSSIWLKISDFTVSWSFLFDNLTIAIFFVVSSVTFLVILFSFFYIAEDERRPIFFFLLTIFAGFMIFLVSAGNYLILFIGWEGVGLSSFLLINFWYTRLQANKAAAKAVIVNRVGDIFLIAALALMIAVTSTLDFVNVADGLSAVTATNGSSINELVCLFLFLAAVGKSAQFGLHTWLPDAIEGPTPVSALLHAATIVTAGIYLIIRSSSLFANAPLVSTLMVFTGLLTAFFAATAALVQYDSKKVVAYSTCSQLGYIMFVAGLGQYSVSFFHLFNHAFFKALLFIAAGSVIHALGNEQDMRRIGGLGQSLVFVYAANFIGVLSLSGSMFLSGFYSKDLILETGIGTFTIGGLVLYWLGLLVAVFTGVYASDILDDIFIEEPGESNKHSLESLHPTTYLEIFIIFSLALLSLFSGYVFRDMFVGVGSQFFSWDLGNSYAPVSINGVDISFVYIISGAEVLPLSIKLLPLICSLLVGFQASRIESEVTYISDCVRFFSYKWYFDMLQNVYLVYTNLRLGYSVFWLWDKYIFEQFRSVRVNNGTSDQSIGK